MPCERSVASEVLMKPSLHRIFPSAAMRLQVVAHSVGTWVAYELLMLARSRGLPMPRKAFLSAMASPDIAAAARPWRQQRILSEAAFQVRLRIRQMWKASHHAAGNDCLLPRARSSPATRAASL